MRKLENRNKPGANANKIFLFNEALSSLGLVEIPLKRKCYTWSNKQDSPLLERLDWFFTSLSWTSNYPNTVATSLAMQSFDHALCIVNVNTNVPRAKIFRFENFWMEHSNFLQVVNHGWAVLVATSDPAKKVMARFKNLRRVLRLSHTHISNLSLLIENIKMLIYFLEIIEEHRDLSVHEWIFKDILNEKLISLLDQQRIYWKQRGYIKYAKFGDGNTKFFHANATIKFRKNSITFLQDQYGEQVFEHNGKTALLWEAFKQRLGISEFSFISYDLANLLHLSHDLDFLELPFSKKEIDEVVKNLPTDKSPGPDGFNTNFIKKCWNIIAPEFYELLSAFFEGDVCLQSINASYVTLVPKKESPVVPADFRPISLLNCSIKLITKILANRLQSIIRSLIS